MLKERHQTNLRRDSCSTQTLKESMHSVLYWGWIGPESECGERLVLLGLEEDWRSEGRTAFECECGRELTLEDNHAEVLADSPAVI